MKETCPECGNDDLDKIYHPPTFAIPECWHFECAECDWISEVN